jgi:hypothetical protein
MHTYLINLTNALAGAGAPQVQLRLKKVADLFQERMIGQVKDGIKTVIDVL